MNFTGELSMSPHEEARNAQRKDVAMGAGLRQRGAHAITIEVLDLSITGFRAATHLTLEAGSDVWLKLPGLESLHARAVWQRGHLLGCEFVRPLHPAVLEMLVRAVSGR
ncbi:MAG: PilZ protein [Alphaproteobacteria bacterium]|nr:PilZ protein [Alphaproteobacteria bacterium]MDB5719726.1 PilZ protein [Alphaproteobacteria bacterium]